MPPSKKMGRPTDNPKRHEIKARIDEECFQILEDYCEREGKTKARAIREGIRRLKPTIDQK